MDDGFLHGCMTLCCVDIEKKGDILLTLSGDRSILIMELGLFL
jgi:hypothetical protein